jgi:hypothetical protein
LSEFVIELIKIDIWQYEIGLSYTIMKMEQQNTNGKEGVEVLQQVRFEDEKLGEGQFTSKVYHLQRFVGMQSSNFCFVSVRFIII